MRDEEKRISDLDFAPLFKLISENIAKAKRRCGGRKEPQITSQRAAELHECARQIVAQRKIKKKAPRQDS
jgi:hypothetical protein